MDTRTDGTGGQPTGGDGRGVQPRPLFAGNGGLDNSDGDGGGFRRLIVLLIFAFVLLVLYLAQEVLIPLALATLLGFLLAIPAAWLERRGLSRVWSVVLVVVMSLGLVAGVGYVVTRQLFELAGELPRYKENLRAKARAFAPAKNGKLENVLKLGQELSKEISGATTTTVAAASNGEMTTSVVASVSSSGVGGAASTGDTHNVTGSFGSPATGTTGVPGAGAATAAGAAKAADGGPAPIPVRVVETERSPFAVMEAWLGPVLANLGFAGIVLVFLLFMLIEREGLRDRIVRLAGQRQITITTRALDEAGDRVSRYMLMTAIVNITYGIPIGIGLFFIGIPNAFLWGLMCTILRFVPYIGPWIGASFPITIAIATSQGWSTVLLVLALFVVIELISNNAIEPMLYGHSTGLSPFAIIVSAVFWTWMWGGVGLFMATPLTVCMLVLSRYVPQLRFLDVLLGDAPVLTPGERLYQRLMARDLDDAMDLVEEERKGRTVVQVYDEVFLPALALAERDRTRGVLSGGRWHFAVISISELVDELGNEPEVAAEEQKKESRLKRLFTRDAASKDLDDRVEAVGAESELEMPYHGGGPGAGVPSAPVVTTGYAAAKVPSAARISDTPGGAEGIGSAAGDAVAAMPGAVADRTMVPAGPLGTPGERPAQAPTGMNVLVLPARDEADELAGQMLAHALRREGASVQMLPATTLGLEMVERAVREVPDAIVISAMPPMAVGSARLLANRIRASLPDSRIVVGLWRAEGDMERCLERLSSARPDALVTTLADGLVQVAPPAPPPAPVAAVPGTGAGAGAGAAADAGAAGA